MTLASISIALKHDPTERTLVEVDVRGRRNRLTMGEEALIRDAILEFHNNGTPLNRKCAYGSSSCLVSTLDAE